MSLEYLPNSGFVVMIRVIDSSNVVEKITSPDSESAIKPACSKIEGEITFSPIAAKIEMAG
jgi:hypothetical protein